MAAGEVDGGIGNVGAAGAVGHFSDPEDERATALELAEAGGGAEMVGLRAFDAGHGERIDHDAERGCAGGGQKLLLDAAAIDHEAGLVAGLHNGLREGDACAAGLVELGEAEEKGFVRGGIAESWAGEDGAAVAGARRSSKTVPERRPASRMIQTCWLRSVVNSRVTTLARRAVAGQEMLRISSPAR